MTIAAVISYILPPGSYLLTSIGLELILTLSQRK